MVDVTELDAAANANLQPRDLPEYERYKTSLIERGHSDEDIDAILRGFIWDRSEDALE